QGYVGFPIDLDGSAGTGHLLLDTPFSILTIEATGLTDTFSGTITMAPGALLDMQVGPEWETAFNADIQILGASNPAAASQIQGSEAILTSPLHIGLNQAHLRFLAPVTVQSQANVDVDPLAWLEFNAATTVTGGQLAIGADGKLEFDGPTTMEGGTFVTPSA